MDEKRFLLALDAGHYLATPGKRCMKSLDPNETREWFLNNRVANYIAERAFMYEGFIVVRVDDPTGRTETTLAERCALANAIDADFYYSVHFNAGMNGKRGGGVVMYCSKGSTKSPEWRDLLYDAIIDAGGLKGDRTEPKARADWYVCKHTNMPAVLGEHGFMDSPDDVPVILTDKYAKLCGYAVADALAKKVGLKRKEITPEPPATPALPVSTENRYKGIDDAPDYARRFIGELMACGALTGTGTEKGIDMSIDMTRILVIVMRYVKYVHSLGPDQPEIDDGIVDAD